MLTKKYFSDHRDWFLRATLGLFVLTLVAYLPAIARVAHPKYVIFFLVMLSAGALVVVTIKATGGYVGRKTGIMDMLVPSSSFEKYLLAWSISLPVALALVLLVVWMVNTILHHLTGIYISNELFFGTAHPSWGQVWEGIRDYLFAACLIHSIVFWGTLSLGSAGSGFWKRAIVGVVIFISCLVLIYGMPHWLGMPENTSAGFPFFLKMDVKESIDGATLWQTIAWAPESLRQILSLIVSASIPVVLWVAAYFKFKEVKVR